MIQGKSKFDGVRGGQSLLGHVASLCIRLGGLLGCLVLLVTRSVLSNVPVIVCLHFVEENFALACLCVRDQELGQQVENILANVSHFLFDARLVSFNFVYIF